MVLFFWVGGIILFLIAAILYCTAPGKMSPQAEKSAKDFFGVNCAHRGLHTKDQVIPENSLTAFIKAHEEGYGLEIDVQLSKDGQVIVFHDNDLGRACGVDELVKNLDWSELSKLSLFDTNEKIPLLTDALEVVGDAPVIVELKPAGKNNAELCQKTLEILRKCGKVWSVESFDPRIGAWFKKNAPDVLRGQLSCPPQKFQYISKLNSILLGHLLTNFLSRPHYLAYSKDTHPFTVKFCRLFEPMNAVWTVRPEDDIKHFENTNDTIIFEYYTPLPKFK